MMRRCCRSFKYKICRTLYFKVDEKENFDLLDGRCSDRMGTHLRTTEEREREKVAVFLRVSKKESVREIEREKKRR